MTDRAKKISELTTTSTVANTDKIVVLKDAANTTAASTRAMTVNAFTQSITKLVQAPIANTTSIANSVTVVSNGTSLVSFLSYSIGAGQTGSSDIKFNAVDSTTNSVTTGILVVSVYGAAANLTYTLASELGTNAVKFDNAPLVNTTSNTVTLYIRRSSAATSNVVVRYLATVF